jgi:hypothetical protein
VKVGDLVRHPGGGGEPPAIGIVVEEVSHDPRRCIVLELSGQYAGVYAEADINCIQTSQFPTTLWFVISESPLTDGDRQDTLQK